MWIVIWDIHSFLCGSTACSDVHEFVSQRLMLYALRSSKHIWHMRLDLYIFFSIFRQVVDPDKKNVSFKSHILDIDMGYNYNKQLNRLMLLSLSSMFHVIHVWHKQLLALFLEKRNLRWRRVEGLLQDDGTGWSRVLHTTNPSIITDNLFLFKFNPPI